MSDMVDVFKALKELRKIERERFGIPCPVCREKLPRANAKILQPQQICRAHKPHYRDPRPHPSAEEYNAIMKDTGWRQTS